MQYYSPLRYPGGKRKLARFIQTLYRSNGLMGAEYVEPYAGGAGVALSLLAGEFVSRIHINDIDLAVHSIWASVLDHSDELCRRIDACNVNMDEWNRQKDILDAVDTGHVDLDPIDIGFAGFFLNRTNRSGILRGGVIGGKSQDGEWKLNARFNKPKLIERIQRIARLRSRIILYGFDTINLIKDVLPTISNRSLVYFDPPYYVKGQGLYHNAYEPEDHVNVARLIHSVRQHWIVSYDDVPEVRDLYSKYRSISYGINYSAQDRYEGSEIIFASSQLTLPAVEDPSRISRRDFRQLELEYS